MSKHLYIVKKTVVWKRRKLHRKERAGNEDKRKRARGVEIGENRCGVVKKF